ncbi:hypothetical protein CRUP_006186 [Coryphaenoides rupestris]|nr:hypothetical protein CRUP_006186 [Coryphaenoides rupestris]
MSRSLISEFIRPLQMSGDKPDLLSVKPTFLTRRGDDGKRTELGNKDEAEVYRQGELLDGQQGLVPSNFVDFVQDEEKPAVQHRDGAKDPGYLNHSSLASQRLGAGLGLGLGLGKGTTGGTGLSSGLSSGLGSSLSSGLSSGLGSGLGSGLSSGLSMGLESLLSDCKMDSMTSSSLAMDLLGTCSNGTGTLDVSIDEVGEDVVPYPRRINLIKQLAKSVIVVWEPPVVPPGWGSISGYNVLVDDEVRMSIPYGGRTKSLIERLNLATNTYRISVQSITERGLSDRLRCSLLVGKDVVVAPYYLRVDNITQVSSELSWMPSNSNYSHTIFLDGSEYDVVKAGGYRYQFFNLKPMTVYKVKAVARAHQVPWQLPLEHREKREISVRWKPPPLSPTGTSNGANVIGYAVCTKGQKVLTIAEVLFPTADYVSVELNRIQGLEAREVIVRTLSAQGESQDSLAALIPHGLLGSPRLPRRTADSLHPPYPSTYPPTHPQPQVQPLPSRAPPHTLPHPPPHHQHHPHHHHQQPQPPPLHPGPHFPTPQTTAGLVSGREPDTKEQTARPWERSPSPLPPCLRSGPNLEPPRFPPRRSPSPQRILPQPQGAPIPNTIAKAMAREAAQRVFAEGNRAEKRNIFSERGNDLHSVISDEEEEGYDSPHARRRGASVDEFLRGSELGRQQHHQYSHSEDYHTESSRGSDLKRLHSIPEVAEEEPDGPDALGQRLGHQDGSGGRGRPGTPHTQRRDPHHHHAYHQEPEHQEPRAHQRLLRRQRSSPRFAGGYGYGSEERGPGRPSRQNTKSPDSGLDCGSEEEGSLGRGYYYAYTSPATRGPVRIIHCEGPVERRALAMGRRRTLMHQCSMEDDYSNGGGATAVHTAKSVHTGDFRSRERPGPGRRGDLCWEGARSEGMLSELDRIIGNASSHGHSDRLDHSGRRSVTVGNQRRPIPSIDGYGGGGGRRHGRGHRSSDFYEEPEADELTRIFVALFDYDPLSMSPNPDAAREELPFKEGQILKVFGNKDTDGFYRAQIRERSGLIPCNMVSEIQTEDEDMMLQLLKQGFLPLNTPVERLERNRRSGRQHSMSTRRMVALYDYDPRESSPNVDVEGELNGHKGLIPSNFLEEVPDDVEVFLSDSPSRYPPDHPARIKTKRVHAPQY